MLGFSLAGSGPNEFAWGSWQIIGLFGLTVLSLIAFIITETKVKTPVLPLSLFKNGIVTFSNITLFLLSAGMMGVMIYAPFFIQGVKGISPSGSGYIMIPMSIVMVFATAFTGQFMTKTGKYKGVAVTGLITASIGIFLLHLISIGTPIYLMVLFLSIIGIGLGLSMPVFSLTVQNAVPLSELGVASASSQLFRNLGNTIGVGILGSVMSSKMADGMKESFAEGKGGDIAKIPPEHAEQFGQLMNPEILLDQPKLDQILASMPADILPVANTMIETLRDVFSDSLTTTFLAGSIIMLLAVITALFVKAIPLVSAKDKMTAKPTKTK